jgi:hypothetical protein
LEPESSLSLEQIAYSNCLPWRTASQSRFSDFVAANALALYTLPLVIELRPKLVIALGKRAGDILKNAFPNLPSVIVWNRARAATAAVKRPRHACSAKIFKALEQ